MTKYQETALIRRAVLKQLKKERRVSTLSFPTTEKKSDWPQTCCKQYCPRAGIR